MKFNKRLMLIMGTSGVVAVVSALLIYFLMLQELDPEKTVKVPVLNTMIQKDEIIRPEQIKWVSFNEGALPSGVIKAESEIIDKKATVDIQPGEYLFSNKLNERGDVSDPLKTLYIIGVDVTNISNCLGTQLEQDGLYYILANDTAIEVRVAGLVDNTGNAVYGNKQVPIKTINLGVKTLADVKLIKQLEVMDSIELVKYPDK